MSDHRCDERCSWRQSDQSLRDLGFDVSEYHGNEPFAGITQKIKHQCEVSAVLHRAMVDGKVRLCTKQWRR